MIPIDFHSGRYLFFFLFKNFFYLPEETIVVGREGSVI